MTVTTSPYTSQSVSSYNASPPPDDGSQVASNQITWSGIKTKLGDPLNTFAAAVNSAISTFASKTINADADVGSRINGALAFHWATATLATDGFVPSYSAVALGAEAGATRDTLQVISATATAIFSGSILVIKQALATEEINVIHATSTAATATGANIFLSGQADYVIDAREKSLTVMYDATHATTTGWYELTRDGPAIASQAQVEAGTSNSVAISPGRAKNIPGINKAWGYVSRSGGTPTLATATATTYSSSEGISSVTDSGAAGTIIALTTAMQGTVYAAGANPQATATSPTADSCNIESLAVGSFTVRVVISGSADTVSFSCWAMGDQ